MKVKIGLKEKNFIGFCDLNGKQVGRLDFKEGEFKSILEGDIVNLELKKIKRED